MIMLTQVKRGNVAPVNELIFVNPAHVATVVTEVDRWAVEDGAPGSTYTVVTLVSGRVLFVTDDRDDVVAEIEGQL